MQKLSILIQIFFIFFFLFIRSNGEILQGIEEKIEFLQNKLAEEKGYFDEIAKEGKGKIEEFKGKAKIDENGAFGKLSEMEIAAQNKNNEQRIGLKRELDAEGTRNVLEILVENDVKRVLEKFAANFGEMDDSVKIGEAKGKEWAQIFNRLEITLKKTQNLSKNLHEIWPKVYRADEEFERVQKIKEKLEEKFKEEMKKIMEEMKEKVKIATEFQQPLNCVLSTLEEFLLLFKFNRGIEVLVNENFKNCQTEWMEPLREKIRGLKGEENLGWASAKMSTMETALKMVKEWVDEMLKRSRFDESKSKDDENAAKGREYGKMDLAKQTKEFLSRLFGMRLKIEKFGEKSN